MNILYIENFIKLNKLDICYIYLIFGNDLYLNKILKNKILFNIKNKNYSIYNIIIFNINEIKLFFYFIENTLFKKTYIYILYISKNILFNIKKINYDKCIFIFICNEIINNVELESIKVLFLRKYIIINSTFNKFNNFINLLNLLKKNTKNISINIYRWLYIIYNKNINLIFKILDLLNNNLNLNVLIYKLNKHTIYNINSFSWIFSIIINDYKLSILSLYIIKNIYYKNVYFIIRSLYKYIISIFYLKNNIYNIDYIFKIYSFNKEYINDIISFFNRSRLKDIFYVIKIIYNIEINFIKYKNNKNFDIIWNKLYTISNILCNK